MLRSGALEPQGSSREFCVHLRITQVAPQRAARWSSGDAHTQGNRSALRPRAGPQVGRPRTSSNCCRSRSTSPSCSNSCWRRRAPAACDAARASASSSKASLQRRAWKCKRHPRHAWARPRHSKRQQNMGLHTAACRCAPDKAAAALRAPTLCPKSAPLVLPALPLLLHPLPQLADGAVLAARCCLRLPQLGLAGLQLSTQRGGVAL